MLSVDGIVHLSASDLVGHLNCHYLTKLDLAVTKGKLDKPSVWDPVLEVLVERGALHEQSYLDHLEVNGLSARQCRTVLDVPCNAKRGAADSSDVCNSPKSLAKARAKVRNDHTN